MSNHYCLQCGTQMVTREIENMDREQCPACGWIHYRQLKVSALVLVENHAGEILLGVRGHQPWKGFWNFPAGYVEFNETPEDAAIREVMEETGLKIEIGKLAGTYFYDDDARGNGLLVVFWAGVVGGEMITNEETLQLGFFSRDAFPENICGAAHDRIAADLLAGRLHR